MARRSHPGPSGRTTTSSPWWYIATRLPATRARDGGGSAAQALGLPAVSASDEVAEQYDVRRRKFVVPRASEERAGSARWGVLCCVSALHDDGAVSEWRQSPIWLHRISGLYALC